MDRDAPGTPVPSPDLAAGATGAKVRWRNCRGLIGAQAASSEFKIQAPGGIRPTRQTRANHLAAGRPAMPMRRLSEPGTRPALRNAVLHSD